MPSLIYIFDTGQYFHDKSLHDSDETDPATVKHYSNTFAQHASTVFLVLKR